MKRRLYSGILALVMFLMTAAGTVVYAAEGAQDTPQPGGDIQTAGAAEQQTVPQTGAETAAGPEQTEGVNTGVISTITPSPTMPPLAAPQTTAQVSVTSMPEMPPEPSNAYGTGVQLDPDKDGTFGVVVVEQKDGEWVVAQEHYYKSHLWFILLAVVAVIVAIMIFILGIFLVNRFLG